LTPDQLKPEDFEPGKPVFHQAPAGLANELTRSYWADPLEGAGAVLAADEIRFYCSLFGMVRRFDDNNLRTASYRLTVGDPVRLGDQVLDLSTAGSALAIPPRESATLVPAEVLLMPHYLIGRIGLTIGLVQKGLLLGAGPQVDPGYQGALACPVYNMTNHPIQLSRGDRLLRIDFVRTGGLARETREKLWKVGTETELYAQQDSLLGTDGGRIPLFPQDRRWRDPLTGY
jgi:deoxycytidine triphosphate deaminase